MRDAHLDLEQCGVRSCVWCRGRGVCRADPRDAAARVGRVSEASRAGRVPMADCATLTNQSTLLQADNGGPDERTGCKSSLVTRYCSAVVQP